MAVFSPSQKFLLLSYLVYDALTEEKTFDIFDAYVGAICACFYINIFFYARDPLFYCLDRKP